jgi:hypothetical protein
MVLADTRRVRAHDADLEWLSAVRDELLALKSLPKEDAVQRQALLSSLMGARLLGDVARSASLLRTGFYLRDRPPHRPAGPGALSRR